jgi:hypothetical protein
VIFGTRFKSAGSTSWARLEVHMYVDGAGESRVLGVGAGPEGLQGSLPLIDMIVSCGTRIEFGTLVFKSTGINETIYSLGPALAEAVEV